MNHNEDEAGDGNAEGNKSETFLFSRFFFSRRDDINIVYLFFLFSLSRRV